jgi:hypothetical protein
MPSLFLCPGCGHSVSSFAAEGEKVVCPGCGKSLGTILPAEPPPARPALPGIAGADAIDDAVPSTPIASAARPAVHPHRHGMPHWVPAVAVLSAVVVIGGAVAAVICAKAGKSAPTDVAWDIDHRPDLRRLKTDAESKALAGDLRGACADYRAIDAMVGSHAVTDPETAELVRTAKVGQDRIYQMLLSNVPPTAAAGTPAGTAPGRSSPPDTGAPAGTFFQPGVAGPDSGGPTSQPAAATATPSGLPTSVQPLPPAPTPPLPPAPAPPLPPQSVALPNPTVPLAAALPGHEADRKIGQSLDAGINFLISRFNNGQIVDGLGADDVRHQGLDALCVYSLLHASQGSTDPRLNIHGPFMVQLLENLKAFPMAGRDPLKPMAPAVYAHSLRAAALAVYNRPEDHNALQADVNWLVNASVGGAYTYDDRYSNASRTSAPPGQGNSNGAQPAPQDQAAGSGPAVVFTPTGNPPANPSATTPPASLLSPFTKNQNNNQPANPNNGSYLPGNNGLPHLTPDMLRQLGQGAGNGQIPWDNSNSQYGLLGVWSGAEVGCEVPNWYWKAVEDHWKSCELPTGQWCYSAYDPDPSLSMSCAGTSSLLIAHEWLDRAAMGSLVGRQPYSPSLALALKWLETGDNSTTVVTKDPHYLGYTAYGIERTALASGFKYFGTHDWYAELAIRLGAYQFPTGAWGNAADGTDSATVNTAYMVLFLSRGRHPVLINKLRFDPYWDNRPKDVANLAKYAGIELERPFNWQVVSLVRPWSDWTDSPILYIASHRAPNLTDDDYIKIKAFADAGGMILTHCDSNSASFNAWVDRLQQKLWPQYPLQTVSRDSVLYSCNYHLAADKKLPNLKAVSNGSRYLLVHCPTDNLSIAWQDAVSSQKDDFQLGINLFVYAAGRSNFRNRLDSPFIPEPTTPPSSTIRIARLKYDGNWNPEPYAYTRFDRYLHWTVGTALDTATIDLASLGDLKPADRPVAILTGNAAVNFTDAQAAAVAAYVKAGGTILIDSTGGNPDFAKSAAALITKAIPQTPLADVAATDPLIAGGSPLLDPLPKPLARPFNTEAQIKTVPIQMIHTAGTGRVIFTPLDLTTGLLGTNTWGIAGYDPEYAQKLVKNLVETAESR